ncbi:inactive polyglycylase TTLL10 isoform X3 [Saccopteryx bilineata]|uniref:inactive polyglycylase TTLL10 isoform X3 n=1 Tax=Saccopteryx bilineata TaxID=59482 RepID=UPI00338D386A
MTPSSPMRSKGTQSRECPQEPCKAGEGRGTAPGDRVCLQELMPRRQPLDICGDPYPRGQPAPAQEAPPRQTMFTRAVHPPRQGAVSCWSLYLARRHHGQTDSPCRGGLTQDRQNAETALLLRGTRFHNRHGDRSQPQAETQIRDPRRRPSPSRRGRTPRQIRGLRPRAARRSRRGVGAASSQRCPHLSVPTAVAYGHTCFIHNQQELHPWAPVGTKRSKRSRTTGVWRSHPRRPDLLGGAVTTMTQTTLLERHRLGEEKQLPSTGCGPFFYIGGTNGASIISSYCKSKGWQRIQDSRRGDYRLKWCEVKCRDSYSRFREGEQLLYQLPNNKLLTTKIGLLSALREYARVINKTSRTLQCAQAESGKDPTPILEELTWANPGGLRPQRILKMEEFFPETYRLDVREEREAFFTLFDETQTWICKPTASNQGKGIFLLQSQDEVSALQTKIQSMEDDPNYRKMLFRTPQARVVQRYIQNPLLLDGKKFDVRSYLLIACAMPYMVFFGHGYARLTLGLYDPHSENLSGHLTNQYMQKKNPLYVLLKEDTVWSMEQLNCYINDKFRKTKGLPRDWVYTIFTKRMQQIMTHCFLAVKSKLECKLGYFDLIGCDFLIDDNFKVWLLEMNSNPALHTNCEVLKEVIPGVVMETLDLALETFQKSLRGQKMLPLLSQHRFVLLYNGETDVWPRLPSSCKVPRPLLFSRPAGEARSSTPPTRAAEKPGARTPGQPDSAQERPRPPTPGPDGAQGGEPEARGTQRQRADGRDPAREPSSGPAEGNREERKSEYHRGS